MNHQHACQLKQTMELYQFMVGLCWLKDLLGRKESVNDPNMGLKTFAYNSFGEVIYEQDAEQSTLGLGNYFTYDELGRLINSYANVTLSGGSYQPSNNSNIRSYQDRRGYNGVGLLEYISRDSNRQFSNSFSSEFTKEFRYDGFGRLARERFAVLDITDLNLPNLEGVSLNSVNAEIEYFYYQDHNLLKQSIYRYMSPDQRYLHYGYSVVNSYYADGKLQSQSDPVISETPQPLLENTSFNVRGQLVQQNLIINQTPIANQVIRYPATGQVKEILNFDANNNTQYLKYQYDAWGNLVNQEQTGISSVSESFTFDKLQRLKTAQVDNTTLVDYDYDELGNLTKKSDYANTQVYDLSAGPNAISRSDLNSGGSINYGYDEKGNLTETTGALSRNYDYDGHNQLLKATGFGEETTYRYDANNSRYFKRDLNSGEITLYLGDRFELIVKGNEKSSKFRLTDNIIITRNKFNVIKRHYLQKDRLGSVSRILDENGYQLHVKGYDAFGKPRNGETWQAEPQLDFTDINASGIDITKRGFTEHEHLDNFELIHMNGRMYDFNNGRFLSVDPFIQGTDSQAINPYSYIQNNPLSGVDPTGYYVIRKHCDIVANKCNKANYTIKQMQDDLSGQTDNGYANRFQMQVAGSNKIGSSMTLADVLQMQTSGKEGMPNGRVTLGEFNIADIGSQELVAQTDHNKIKQKMRERCELLGNVNCDSYRNEYDAFQENSSAGSENVTIVGEELTDIELIDVTPLGPINKIRKANKARKAIKAKRAFNITKAESKIWKDFQSAGRGGIKTTGSGKNKRYFEWDHTHNDIEVYDKRGVHLGSMHPETGEIYKPAIKGRDIKDKL